MRKDLVRRLTLLEKHAPRTEVLGDDCPVGLCGLLLPHGGLLSILRAVDGLTRGLPAMREGANA